MCDGQGYVEEENSEYRPVTSRVTKVFRYNGGKHNLPELLKELNEEECFELTYAFAVAKMHRGEAFWSRWNGMTAGQIIADYESIKKYLISPYSRWGY